MIGRAQRLGGKGGGEARGEGGCKAQLGTWSTRSRGFGHNMVLELIAVVGYASGEGGQASMYTYTHRMVAWRVLSTTGG